MRPAVRLAALSEAHVIYSWTHDSIGLGEDGPTHQPVEHLASLRAMPGLALVRPADANETAQAWRLAVEADGPVGLVLTRQDVPVLDGTAERGAGGVAKGGYVLVDEAAGGAPDIVLIGTGSEVQLCLGAAEVLAEAGVAGPGRLAALLGVVRGAGRRLPRRGPAAGRAGLSVEAGATFGWSRYADASVGLDHFGASAAIRTLNQVDYINITSSRRPAAAGASFCRSHPTSPPTCCSSTCSRPSRGSISSWCRSRPTLSCRSAGISA